MFPALEDPIELGDDTENRKLEKILILSENNFFSQCLTEAIKHRIGDCEVEHMVPEGAVSLDQLGAVRLILIYDKTGKGLLEMSEFLHRKHPRAAICAIVDSLEGTTEALRDMIDNQALKGVIPASLQFDLFMSVIDVLLKGGEHFPAALISRIRNGPEQTVQSVVKEKAPILDTGGSSNLTARELEILEMICEGVQNKNIAFRLSLSENTVKVHVRNIYKKMRVRNRTEATYLYFKQKGINRPLPEEARLN